MLDFWQMFEKILIALILGTIIGLERESVGKEAGIRTSIVVCVGATVFTLAGLSLPYIIGQSPENISEILARNSGFLAILANIVVGIGFLGAGIIIKTEERIHGLTTAAIIWFVAAIGLLIGIGLIKLATTTTILITSILYLLRKLGIIEKIKN
ncbi:MAG: MgtC/SapB family protein, partial [Patescibacteria group bacterium]|nr:MgtC/SapB family protein [Patescibacteria group bacterium]